MNNLTKKEALSVIYQCASAYNNNLVHKNLLFITIDNKTASCFEVTFLPRNFLHLTGVQTKHKSADFYALAVKKRLCETDIILPGDGTATLKLKALPSLMNIHYSARMVGDYINSKTLLVTDKIAGTVTAAMGFRRNGDLYVPNTALSTDMRSLVNKPVLRIAAIFIKAKNEVVYHKMTYLAKGLDIGDGRLSQIINEKVSLISGGTT